MSVILGIDLGLLSAYLFRVIERSIEVALDPAWHWQLIKMIFSDNFDNDVSNKIKM